MSRRPILAVLSIACLVIGLVALRSARASISLATPIVSTTSAVACVAFQCNWGAGTDLGPTYCTIVYAPVDTNGNFIAGGTQQQSGVLPNAALNAFVSTTGNARVRCQAALISALPALAGDAQ